MIINREGIIQNLNLYFDFGTIKSKGPKSYAGLFRKCQHILLNFFSMGKIFKKRISNK